MLIWLILDLIQPQLKSPQGFLKIKLDKLIVNEYGRGKGQEYPSYFWRIGKKDLPYHLSECIIKS